MRPTTIVLLAILLSIFNNINAQDIPKQSLAQFAYDVIESEGITSAIDTLNKHSNSTQFYLSQDEVFKTLHILFQSKRTKEYQQYEVEIKKHFPKLNQSLAMTLFSILEKQGVAQGKKWIQKNRTNPAFYVSKFELNTTSNSFFKTGQMEKARVLTELFVAEDCMEDDGYIRLAEICLAEEDEQLAMQYLRNGVATNGYISFMELATRPYSKYIPTQLPRDTTLLFQSKGNEESDTVYIFIQGGPMPDISAYRPRPLTLLPNQENFLRVDVLQSQMINQTILNASPTLTEKQSIYEHHVSAEMMHRSIQYFKERGKTVFVIGHSYGCYIGFAYLLDHPNMADKLILMGADLDEDLRNYQVNEDGSRKFIRFRNGTEPYERDFWGGFPLIDLLSPKMETIFTNVESLVSSHAKRRFTQLLKGKDLSNVIFYYARFDEANGRTTKAELDFFKAHGVETIESYGDHHSMLYKSYMTNIYEYLNNTSPIKRSIATTLNSDIESKGIDFALNAFEKYSRTADYFPINEFEINMLGYQLVNQGKLKEAIEIFKINVAAFPNSWNVYDSLGETYLANGEIELGKANYQKSLELHPGNVYAIKALRKK